MRMSDWSSDVCSSDLSRGFVHRNHLVVPASTFSPLFEFLCVRIVPVQLTVWLFPEGLLLPKPAGSQVDDGNGMPTATMPRPPPFVCYPLPASPISSPPDSDELREGKGGAVTLKSRWSPT